MLSMILGVVLAAAPELDAPRAAVWVNLVPTVVVPALVKRPSGSIGVTFGIAQRFAIVADAAFFPFPHPFEMPCADGDGWMLWSSAGAAFRPFANDDGIGGFFLLPKLTFRFADTKGTRRFGNDDDPCIRFTKYESGADFSLGLALQEAPARQSISHTRARHCRQSPDPCPLRASVSMLRSARPEMQRVPTNLLRLRL